MPATFVPLQPASWLSSPAPAKAPAGLKTTTVPGVPGTNQLEPARPAAPAALPVGAAAFIPLVKPDPDSPVQITVQKQGDRISRICIQCACGQQIELACLY